MKTVTRQAVVLLCTIILPCTGQDTGTTRPGTSGTPLSGVLQPETVSAEIERLEIADVDPGVKKAALGFYAQALEQLEAARKSAEQSRRIEQVRRDIIRTELPELKARLARAASQPATAPQPFIPADMALSDLDQMARNAEAEVRSRQQTVSNEDELIATRAERRELLRNRHR